MKLKWCLYIWESLVVYYLQSFILLLLFNQNCQEKMRTSFSIDRNELILNDIIPPPSQS